MATTNTCAYIPGKGWFQYLPGMPEHAFDGASIILHNVHSARTCRHWHCVIHNPLAHHMEDWPLIWRSDRLIFERICPHGLGHPDPSQFDYWDETGQEYQGIHGCDFCCA
jgi:hypothetical protein